MDGCRDLMIIIQWIHSQVIYKPFQKYASHDGGGVKSVDKWILKHICIISWPLPLRDEWIPPII